MWSTNPLFLTVGQRTRSSLTLSKDTAVIFLIRELSFFFYSLQNREDALSPAGQEQVVAACAQLQRDPPTVVKYSLAASCIDAANIVGHELRLGARSPGAGVHLSGPPGGGRLADDRQGEDAVRRVGSGCRRSRSRRLGRTATTQRGRHAARSVSGSSDSVATSSVDCRECQPTWPTTKQARCHRGRPAGIKKKSTDEMKNACNNEKTR